MAKFDNPEEVEETDDDDDTIIDDTSPSTGRTTIDQPGTLTHISLQQELLQSAVDDFYNVLAEWGEIPSLGPDRTKFELVKGRLQLKAYPNERIINLKTGKPLSLSTIKERDNPG